MTELVPIHTSSVAVHERPAGMLDHVTLSLVNSFDRAQEFMRWMGERRPMLGVDTETSGLVPHKDKVRLIQFGDLNQGWALPWERWGGLALEVLNGYTGDLALHNSPFDIRMLTYAAPDELKRWPWERTWDTMTMSHLVSPASPHGLKPLSGMLIDRKAAAAQSQLDAGMVDNHWSWATVPLDYPPYWIYGALDPVLTCYLQQHFKPLIPNPRLLDMEMATLRIVTAMMLKGARIDLDYCWEATSKLSTFSAQARDWLHRTYGLANPTSSVQALEAFKRAGVTVPLKFTKGGAQALDKEVLEAIDHPLATYILAVKQSEKMVSTYFDNFREMVDENGRVHANIRAQGARTGRMTVTEPALQTLKKKSGIVRNAFIPADEHSLVSVDADQIEARLMAHFSQDAGLKAAFLSSDDFFTGLAKQIFRDETIHKDDKRRQLTKGVIYGKLYGAGVPTMARTAKVSESQMAEVVAGFEQTFPGVKVFQQAVNGAAISRYRAEGEAYITTPFGRKLLADDNREYALVNYLLQGHAAEIFKLNLAKLDAVGLGPYLMLPVHDEIVMEVPNEEADNALKLAIETMNDDDGYFVPITWSGEVMAGAWGAKYAD